MSTSGAVCHCDAVETASLAPVDLRLKSRCVPAIVTYLSPFISSLTILRPTHLTREHSFHAPSQHRLWLLPMPALEVRLLSYLKSPLVGTIRMAPLSGHFPLRNPRWAAAIYDQQAQLARQGQLRVEGSSNTDDRGRMQVAIAAGRRLTCRTQAARGCREGV